MNSLVDVQNNYEAQKNIRSIKLYSWIILGILTFVMLFSSTNVNAADTYYLIPECLIVSGTSTIPTCDNINNVVTTPGICSYVATNQLPVVIHAYLGGMYDNGRSFCANLEPGQLISIPIDRQTLPVVVTCHAAVTTSWNAEGCFDSNQFIGEGVLIPELVWNTPITQSIIDTNINKAYTNYAADFTTPTVNPIILGLEFIMLLFGILLIFKSVTMFGKKNP